MATGWRGASRPRRWRSWLLLAVGAAVVLGLAVQRVSRHRGALAAHPQHHGRATLDGLEAPVQVVRDRRGVPHVSAASELDAWRGLGFVHAQDRPTQLLWLRRAARGRLAEVVGAEALPGDRRARLLGFAHLASAEVERLPARTRGVLDAYAEGVNAVLLALGEGRSARPPLLDGWDLAPWTAADSLAIQKLHAWMLGGTLDETLVLGDLRQHLEDGFEAGLYFPSGSGLESLPRPGEEPVTAQGTRGPVAPLRRALGLSGPSVGSTAFVIGSGSSRSGRPLLAADSHFEPTVPAALYQAHLRGGALDVAGAGPPGVPVFWSGFNRDVAWAAVAAPVVVTDLFVETLTERAPARYKEGSAWRPLLERREEIPVRGAEPDVLAVRTTRRGPLIDALFPEAEPRLAPLALRWAGAEPGAGTTGFLDVAHARDAEGLRHALRRHHVPTFLVAYADREGAAGVQMAGFVPDRELPTGLLSVPAADAGYRWRGRIAGDALPSRSIREGEGFEVVADAPLEAGPGILLEWLWRPGERSARLERLLYDATGRGRLGLRDLPALQRDARSERAGEILARALALAGEGGEPLGEEEREAMRLLSDWDRSTEPGSRGAAAYHVFLERLTRSLLEPRLGEDLLRRYLALGRVRASELVLEVLASAEDGLSLPWAERATVAEAVRRSLRQTWLRLSVELGANREKWRWGRLHVLRFRSLFEPLGGASLGPFPYGGDAGTLQVGGYRTLDSFDVTTVASFRMFLDTASLDEALTSLAPGQSEHAGHRHRDDELARWLAGRPGLLATSELVVEETAVARLLLVPGTKAPPAEEASGPGGGVGGP